MTRETSVLSTVQSTDSQLSSQQSPIPTVLLVANVETCDFIPYFGKLLRPLENCCVEA